MTMKKCPICGEEYSDTYKTCPFCEEEKAMSEGSRKTGRRAMKRSRQFNLITPTLLILIVIMAGLLVYLLYGDRIADKFGGEENLPVIEQPEQPGEDEENQGEEEQESQTGEEDHPVMPETVDPETKPENKPETKPENKPETKPETKPKPQTPASNDGFKTAMALPAGLTLSTTDFTVKVAGEVNQIRASGGSGSYHWYSENPNVASVDAKGNVTALSKGTVTIVASDGSKKGECIVRVNVSNTEPIMSPSETSKPSNAKLSKEDYTTSVGEATVKLTVSGTSSPVTWSSADSSVATVSSDGEVKAVGKGTTTITAKVDGAALTCIVRVRR